MFQSSGQWLICIAQPVVALYVIMADLKHTAMNGKFRIEVVTQDGQHWLALQNAFHVTNVEIRQRHTWQ